MMEMKAKKWLIEGLEVDKQASYEENSGMTMRWMQKTGLSAVVYTT